MQGEELQAIFGFQLIAVFNERFADDLEKPLQELHLAALCLVALAAALVMTPAAYHRTRGARITTSTFVGISTRVLLWSMAPLALGLSLDVFVIATLVFESMREAAILAVVVFAIMVFQWFAFPRLPSIHRRMLR
jgi:hypothetical protein